MHQSKRRSIYFIDGSRETLCRKNPVLQEDDAKKIEVSLFSFFGIEETISMNTDNINCCIN
jgi:hypothetical protein